jgi:ribosomal protein L29
MMRKLVCGVFAVLVLVACSNKQHDVSGEMAKSAPAPMQARSAAPDGAGSVADAEAAVSRHIELRHTVVIEVAADKLEGVWRERLEACKLPACEVVAAGIENQRGDMGTASLSLRIVPAQAGGLLDTLRGLGKLAQHQMSQTDRTNEVVDIQARLNNQKALRDRLRVLVASHNLGKLSELLEVERELARVQTEIDSAEGQMRATLAVTEKTSFDINFRTPASIARPGSWEPIRYAWNNMGRVFADSLAALMYFVAGGLPWFVIGGVVLWGLRRLWRLRRARRDSKPA